MSYTAGDCYQGIQGLLMNRVVQESAMLETIRKAVLEFTEDYKHPLLERTGPIVSFEPFVASYAPNYFLNTPDDNLDVNKVNSFFLYNNPYVVPAEATTESNSGYNLTFMSFDDIEVLLNIPSVPLYWSRNNNQILIGSMPDNAYNVYMRYQIQHPSTNLPNGFTAATPIMMADSWQEVLEYACAMRLAPQVNLADKKEELHSSLYGDQKFQTSGGIEGAPGLIFQRTSQRNRDQRNTTRRLRLRMGNVG